MLWIGYPLFFLPYLLRAWLLIVTYFEYENKTSEYSIIGSSNNNNISVSTAVARSSGEAALLNNNELSQSHIGLAGQQVMHQGHHKKMGCLQRCVGTTLHLILSLKC